MKNLTFFSSCAIVKFKLNKIVQELKKVRKKNSKKIVENWKLSQIRKF